MHQAIRRLWVVLAGLSLVLAAVQTGAASQPLLVTDRDSSKTLSVKVGQKLLVDLKLEGDEIAVAPQFDPFILTLLGQTLQSTSGPKGSVVRVKYEFEARKAGQTDLIFQKMTPPFKIHLVVAPGVST